MSSNEVWAKCGDCGSELKQSDKQCPKCGSTKKAYERKAFCAIGLKATASVVHEAHWSPKSYAILAILLALFFGLVSLIPYGVYELLPLPIWLRIVLTVIVFFMLLIVGWWQNYWILMSTRWLDRKSVARKTFKSK